MGHSVDEGRKDGELCCEMDGIGSEQCTVLINSC
jgi:hypothetical protein